MSTLLRRREMMQMQTAPEPEDQPIGVNLLDWDSGESDSGRPYTKWIPILDGATYIVNVLSTNFTDVRNVDFYDAGKTLLKRWRPSVSAASNISVNAQMPDGAKYMRGITYTSLTETYELIRTS